MLVLGLNGIYHEISASLVDGKYIIAACEEERFNGVKHGKNASAFSKWPLPIESVGCCLETGDVGFGDITDIAYSYSPGKRIRVKLPAVIGGLLKGNTGLLEREFLRYYFCRNAGYFLSHELPTDLNRRKRFVIYGKPKWRFHFVEHHLAHAASSFFVSPFDHAAILSVDGIGENTCTLLAEGHGESIARLKEIQYPHSLGFFYEEITKYLGFRRNNDEYKVMALAAYGEPRYRHGFDRLITTTGEGGYKVNIDFIRSGIFGAQELSDVLGPPRLWGADLTERHADIAASAQKVLEDVVLHILDWLFRKTKCENLCLAGGVALNCVLNERVKSESSFKNIFVQPAAHDAGTSLGGALWVKHGLYHKRRDYVMTDVYLGPRFDDAQIEEALGERKIPFRLSRDVSAEVAKLIATGKVVGWFQGRMEWGPRALGNRSILGDPRDPYLKDTINRIKGREEFRPLAPSVLAEYTGEYFDSPEPSPFMLFARKVKPSMRALIPAVVHVDGTARLQTVSADVNPLFYELINRFRDLTGVPMVVNTSLNYAGRPIVCTITQALDCFINSGLDYLTMGPYIISKGNDYGVG